MLRLRKGANNVANPVQTAGAHDRIDLVDVRLELGVVKEVRG